MLTHRSRHTVNKNRTRRKARRGRTYSRRARFEQLEKRLLLTTYTSTDVFPLAIPDQTTVTSVLMVANSVTIGDINVTLDITHTSDQDLDVFLIAPDSTRVELFTDVGGGGDHFSGTTLDDEAVTPITAGSAPFNGSYQPEGSLSDFDGAEAQGTWTLELTDDKRRKTGTLNSWSIEVTPAGPPSLSISDGTITEGGSLDVFVPSGSGGLDDANTMIFGPDGNLYVSVNPDAVLRFDGSTGAFIDQFISTGSGGLDDPKGSAFGPDGNFYVSSGVGNRVLRYDGSTGAFIDEFISTGSGGLDFPRNLQFHSDGKLYVDSAGSDQILRYDSATGAFIDVFVDPGSSGFNISHSMFGPDGNLYVNSPLTTEVLRYDGSTGAFIDIFVTAGSGGEDDRMFGPLFGPDGHLYMIAPNINSVLRFDGSTGGLIDIVVSGNGLDFPRFLAFDAQGNLLVNNRDSDDVLRYSEGLAVNLSSSSSVAVTVNFATSDGSATAGDDYAALNRTLTFAPGETSKTILLAAIDDLAFEGDETFTVTLSNPTGNVTIIDAAGTATITDDDTPPPTLSISDGTIAEEGAFETFVTAGSGGLDQPRGLVFGPDGNFYVASHSSDQVLRYSGTTGAFTDVFVPAGSGGLDRTSGLAFGPDGSLYVVSAATDNILRFQGPGEASPGAFVDEFVTTGSGLDNPHSLVFGADGNLYVTSRITDNVLRYQGPAGVSPGALIDEFVTAGSGWLKGPSALVFGPDDNLYVTDTIFENVQRFQGLSGTSPGAFMDEFVAAGSGGLINPFGLAFGPTGDLYVSGAETDNVLRFQGPGGTAPGALVYEAVPAGTSGLDSPAAVIFDLDGNLYVSSRVPDEVLKYSQGVTATLSSPSAVTVTVDFATSDGSATAGSDYAALSRTLTFAPGETSKTILLAATDDLAVEADETFTVTLSNPTGGVTITDGSATATIIDDDSLRQVTINDVTATEGDDSIHFRGKFVPSGAEGTDRPRGLLFDAAGILYVASDHSDEILRYDGNGALIDAFVTAGSGGLDRPFDLVLGPDGNLYVSSENQDLVLRYDGLTGAFVDVFVTAGDGGLDTANGVIFGPDGNLYVASGTTDEVLRYSGSTGDFMDVFVSSGSGGLDSPKFLRFGPDSNLYASGFNSDKVIRYDGTTGALIGDFVTFKSGGLDDAEGILFGPDGNFYVVSYTTDEVLRYDGGTGSFIDTYVTAGSGGVDGPHGIAFDSDGNLYVSSTFTDDVMRYGTVPEAAFTVTISSPSTLPVTVDFTTSDGTATVVDGDYTAVSGTITFGPGVTARTIIVPTIDDAVEESTESFFVDLSGASGSTISDGQGEATILDNDAPLPSTKFFVVDDSVDDMFEYQADGSFETNYDLASGNNSPRGAAAIAAGDTVWVIDNDDHVYVHDSDGNLLRSWKALGLSRPEGIATDGTDVWIVDRGNDRVHYFAAGATRTSDTSATSSFSLAAGDPRGITTDGTHHWVVDARTDDVYKYTISGTLVGSWALDSGNTVPRGITIDPGSVNDIWVVDSTDDAIYQYSGAASRTSGSQSADAIFSLAARNTNPQGIADPPASMQAEPVAIPALDVGLVPLIKKRAVVDRGTETFLDLAMPPIAVKKQAAINGPAVDTVMTDMGTRNPYDSDDDEEELPASLEEALEDLVLVL